MKYVWQENTRLFLKFATRIMGVSMDWEHPELTVQEGIARLENFFQSLGLVTRLRDMPQVGMICEEVMRRMAKRVRRMHADGSIGELKRLGTEDIVNIFRLAL